MLPVIALVGRPNVGKSTLFNRLTRSRDALVADFPGLTRDRQYGEGRVGPRPYIVVDTGGFEPVKSQGIVKAMASQAELAIEEADVVIFVVDARTGLTPHDERIANHLRRTHRPVILAVNKAEGLDSVHAAEFYELAMGEPNMISAAHGHGVHNMIELALSHCPEEEIALVDDEIKELPHLLALSKKMMRTIKLNLTFSMGLNFLAIALAVTGILGPVVGALVHNAGSVVVIINSALLLRWKQQ